jgi:uncharacterized membrane protein
MKSTRLLRPLRIVLHPGRILRSSSFFNVRSQERREFELGKVGAVMAFGPVPIEYGKDGIAIS